MRKRLLLAAALAVGCGSSNGAPDADAARASDVELTTRAVDRALGAATLFVSMGVIAPNMPAEVSAGALHQRVLSETNSCAQVTVTGTSLDVDLSTGCTLASTNVVYGGTLHAEVSKPTATTLQVQATLNLTVDGGEALSGVLILSTDNGNTFTYQAVGLTFGGVTVSAPVLRAGIASFGAQFDLGGMVSGATGTYALTLTGVHQRFAGCFADDGLLELSSAPGTTPAVDEFWRFASDAPQTGHAAVGKSATDSAPRTVSLSKRMGCPTGTAATK